MDKTIYGVKIKLICYPYAEGYGIKSVDEALKELLTIKFPNMDFSKGCIVFPYQDDPQTLKIVWES